MDIGRALTFYTEDPRWKEKLAIGTGVVLISSLLSAVLIGILGLFIVAGYCIRLVQNVQGGEPNPLPEWDQWGEDLVRGLKYVGVILIWSLPAIFMLLPSIFGAAMSESGGEAARTAGSFLIFCSTCLVVLYSLVISFLVPGVTVAFAETDKFESGLQVRRIWAWTRGRLGDVVIIVIVTWVASLLIPLAAAVVGTLLCVIGLVVTLPLGTLIMYLFQYHLYGQLGVQGSVSDLPEPAPIG